MNYEIFVSSAQPWMKTVCHELFAGDVFSRSSLFDYLFDYDYGSNLAHGFAITTPFTLSMGDFVHMNQVCSKNCCFYVVRPVDNSNFCIHFYLESHG